MQRAGDIVQLFDDISYAKGCAVIRMISSFLGEKVFLEGIRRYLKQHTYGNTKTSDLWESLSQISGHDIGSIMQIWTKNVGYPIVTVTEDQSTSTITISQQRFLQNETPSADDDNITYPLFVRLRTIDGIDEIIQLFGRTTTIRAPMAFYKLNGDHTGFYRTAYTPQRLQILGQNAKIGILSAEDRIGLVSDALAMASSGNASARTSTVLSLLAEFEDEYSHFVWKQILNTLTTIVDAWAFEPPEVLHALNLLQNRLLAKCLLKKGWSFSEDDDDMEQMFKSTMFSHAFIDHDVKQAAKVMFTAYEHGDRNAININILEAVFANVLMNEGNLHQAGHPIPVL